MRSPLPSEHLSKHLLVVSSEDSRQDIEALEISWAQVEEEEEESKFTIKV